MLRLTLITAAFMLIAVAAHADPCTAITDRGPLPAAYAPGRTFSGTVVYVADGDSLCVSVGPRRGRDWVEVRLSDFYAPELRSTGGVFAKGKLEGIAMGRSVACRADHRSYDRIVAVCTLGGVSLGDRMRRAGVSEGGNGRR